MAEYWPSSFCVFDLTLTPTHKNTKTKNKKKNNNKQANEVNIQLSWLSIRFITHSNYFAVSDWLQSISSSQRYPYNDKGCHKRPRTNLVLRSHVEKVKSPDVCWDTGICGIIAKNSNPTTLGKFVIFIIKVFWRMKWNEMKIRNLNQQDYLPFTGTLRLLTRVNLCSSNKQKGFCSLRWFNSTTESTNLAVLRCCEADLDLLAGRWMNALHWTFFLFM